MIMRKFKATVLLICFFICSASQAGVIVGGTRLIYQEKMKEINISLDNQDTVPYLMKSWIEATAQGTPHFLVTPPLFRLEAKQKNILRIFKTDAALPDDRESLFYLNSMAIPSGDSQDANSLQIAIRNRLKLFYRPKALLDSAPEEVTDKLIWEKTGNQLKVTNPTPFYMNFMTLSVANKKIKDINFIAPFSTESYPLAPDTSNGDIEWKIINDYGGIGPIHKAKI